MNVRLMLSVTKVEVAATVATVPVSTPEVAPVSATRTQAMLRAIAFPSSNPPKKRSGFERKVINDLDKRHQAFSYESLRLSYLKFYIPDIELPNGILIELKGWFKGEDRHKALAVRAANPSVDLRFVFQADNKLVNSRSTTRYSDWCNMHGFKYHIGPSIPQEWLDE